MSGELSRFSAISTVRICGLFVSYLDDRSLFKASSLYLPSVSSRAFETGEPSFQHQSFQPTTLLTYIQPVSTRAFRMSEPRPSCLSGGASPAVLTDVGHMRHHYYLSRSYLSRQARKSGWPSRSPQCQVEWGKRSAGIAAGSDSNAAGQIHLQLSI